MARKSERGAVLIVSMIFLIVLTVIGLAGMDVTSLEEKMAGNMRDRNMAFQAAEATLRDAEGYLQSVVFLPTFGSSTGLYNLPGDGTKRWDTVDWSSASEVLQYQGEGFDELAGVPGYIIEDLAAAASDDSLALGVSSDTQRYYRITVRAVGLTDTSVVILQSVYKR